MVVILAEGPPGSTKTMFIVDCARIAQRGGKNTMLRSSDGWPRQYRTEYTLHSNMALFFCHPSKMSIDKTGLVTYLPGCNDPLAQPGGDLDPMDLVQRAWHDKEFESYTGILGHEWHEWNESRITVMLPKRSKLRRILGSYLYDQTRKLHIDFYCDTQSIDKLDNRLRDNPAWLVQCTNHARDIENDPPIPEYHVFTNPSSRSFKEFVYWPPPAWSKMLMPLYNTWETPKYRSEAEVAVDEYEKEMEQLEENIKGAREFKIEAEIEREGTDARKSLSNLRRISREVSING